MTRRDNRVFDEYLEWLSAENWWRGIWVYSRGECDAWRGFGSGKTHSVLAMPCSSKFVWASGSKKAAVRQRRGCWARVKESLRVGEDHWIVCGFLSTAGVRPTTRTFRVSGKGRSMAWWCRPGQYRVQIQVIAGASACRQSSLPRLPLLSRASILTLPSTYHSSRLLRCESLCYYYRASRLQLMTVQR